MHTSNWFSILVLLGAMQGIFILIAIARSQRKVAGAGRHLKYVLWAVTVTLIGRVVYLEAFSPLTFKILLFGDLIIFLYGPLLYFYLEEYLNVQPTSNRTKWLHFLPALGHLLVISPYFFAGSEYFVSQETFNKFPNPLIEPAAIVQNLIYLYFNWKLVRTHEVNTHHYLSSSDRISFLKRLLFVVNGSLIFWLCAYSACQFGIEYFANFLGYNFTWLGISFMTFVLAFYAINHPSLLQPKAPVNGSSVKNDEETLKDLAPKLEEIMKQQKPHLDPELTLPKLSTSSEIPVHLLSKLLNTYFKRNFSDFVNGYRVNEFTSLVKNKNNRHFTLLALAYEAGFNSKTTFNMAFKKIMRMTPSQYQKTVKT